MSTNERPHILFLNMGWKECYEGPDADDPTRGNFGYLNTGENYQDTCECYNFSNLGGFCFGNHPGGAGTEVQRLGGRRGAESVDDVLVVWFSRNPSTRKAVIVGWYEHATVYRRFQKPKLGEGHLLDDKPLSFKTKAQFQNCRVLDYTDRSFPIPNRFDEPGGYGQCPIWYGLGDEFLDKVWKFIQDRKANQGTTIP